MIVMKRSIDLIKSDLYRHAGNTRFSAFLRHYVLTAGFNYMVWHRLGSQTSFKPLRAAFFFILQRKQLRFGIQIPLRTKIGFGFYIGHSGNIVVSSTASFGSNCNISQGVTVGSNLGKAATIGSGVYIGPNACIIEAVSIADNATIGAGSIVTKDVLEGATVAGVPAKTIQSRSNDSGPGRFIQNPWPTNK
ncbi:serine O-acetyltransferase [Cupriavidus sp. IDO]|uniref:serine O-acetyltransferase n=1 Tax=Cupriavidus sp. IDO TaxID=1539142 RepID=UPI001269C8F1|nr:serine acetyltransferase [Cupriavidus sp. IDO]